MKVILLAGGFGSRLSKMVALDTPKTKIFRAQIKININTINNGSKE
mgnify:CR=1 FL=1